MILPRGLVQPRVSQSASFPAFLHSSSTFRSLSDPCHPCDPWSIRFYLVPRLCLGMPFLRRSAAIRDLTEAPEERRGASKKVPSPGRARGREERRVSARKSGQATKRIIPSGALRRRPGQAPRSRGTSLLPRHRKERGGLGQTHYQESARGSVVWSTSPARAGARVQRFRFGGERPAISACPALF